MDVPRRVGRVLAIVAMLACGGVAVAQTPGDSTADPETTTTSEEAASDDTRSPIRVEVAGMVCGFCASGIERTMDAHEAIDSLEFSFDESVVTVHLNSGAALGDDTIRTLISEAGYDIVSITR